MKKNSSIDPEILSYHERCKADPHHRFRSWEHCYKFFQTSPQSKKEIDMACLHLAFYLASWGMYRGSGFLLQKDYLIHRSVVEELLKPEYNSLRGIELEALSNRENYQNVFILIRRIKEIYKRQAQQDKISKLLKEKQKPINVTDTLATKILLGTLGCTPAYDRYFISGLRYKQLKYSTLNEQNFSKMLKYCFEKKELFEKAQSELSSSQIEYPVMKIVDMYFWQIGEEIERREK